MQDEFTRDQLTTVQSALAAITALGTPDAAETTGALADYAALVSQHVQAIAQAFSAIDMDSAAQLAECTAQIAGYLPVSTEREAVQPFLSAALSALGNTDIGGASSTHDRLTHEGQALIHRMGGHTSADTLAAMFDMSTEERALFGLDDLQDVVEDLSESDLSDLDPFTVFLAECRDRLEGLSLHLGALRHNPSNADALIDVRRAFHTLKGGAALLRLSALERLTKALQFLIDEHAKYAPVDSRVIELLERGHLLVEGWIDELAHGSPEDPELGIEGQADLEIAIKTCGAPAAVQVAAVADRPTMLAGVSQNLYSAYVMRLPQDMRALHNALMQLRSTSNDATALAEARRALHGLKSRSSMVQIMPLVHVAGRSESLLDVLITQAGDVYQSVALIDLIIQSEDLFYHTQDLLRQGSFDANYPELAQTAENLCREMDAAIAQEDVAADLEVATAVGSHETQPISAMQPDATPLLEAMAIVAENVVPIAAEPAVDRQDTAPLVAEASQAVIPSPSLATSIDTAAFASTLASLLAATPEADVLVPEPIVPLAEAKKSAKTKPTAPERQTPARPTAARADGEILATDLNPPLVRLSTLETLLNANQIVLDHAGDLISQQRRSIERLDTLVMDLVLEREELRRRNRLLRERLAPRGGDGWDELEIESYDAIDGTMVQLGEIVADGRDISRDLRNTIDRAQTATRRIAGYAGGARSDLLSLRMITLASQRERLEQIAVATASRLGRQVHFVMEAEALLDREIATALEVPLQHMVRNAVVHGIEDPEDRRRLGKPDLATVWLRASESPAGVTIEVGDDGRGLDLDRLVAVSVGRGVITSAQAATLTPQQRQELIFHPGVSTAEQPSDLAGRGVGMDAVLDAVRHIRGAITIDSVPGRGAVLTIRAPRSLSTALVVLVRQGEHELALPFEQVVDSYEVNPTSLVTTSGGSVLPLKGRLLPVQVVGLLGQRPQDEASLTVTVVEIGTFNGPIGVLVGEVVGVEMTLIDPLPRLLRQTQELLGFLPVASGRVRPLVDAARVLTALSGAVQVSTPSTLPMKQRQSVLVVDDSPSVRRHLRDLFSQAGYLVREAPAGVDALQDIARRGLPSLITLDIEMPGMDGLETLNALRQTYGAAVPIFMISSRAQERHRDAARALGATQYFNKPFNPDEVIGAVRMAMSPHEEGAQRSSLHTTAVA